MDVRDWPWDQIMQLPDCCFGRRFLVSCTQQGGAGVPLWDISEIAFPERCVIWEFIFWSEETATAVASFRVALGNQLPATVAMMDVLEPVFPGFGVQGPDPRRIANVAWGTEALRRLRLPIAAMGRKLVLEVTGVGVETPVVCVAVVVSSIPTEVPDCLVSEYLRSR